MSAMHCLKCGYDLSGLDQRRCPECGSRFDPNNPSTYWSHALSGRFVRNVALVGLVLTLVPPLIAIIVVYSTGSTWHLNLFSACPVLMLAGFALSSFAALQSGRALMTGEPVVDRVADLHIACSIGGLASAAFLLSLGWGLLWFW